MEIGFRTHSNGLYTSIAKNEPRYNIYLERIAVYRYIVAPLCTILLANFVREWKTVEPDQMASSEAS